MKSILISIRKEYNDKIIEGAKHWEGRKKIPKELKRIANIGKLLKPIIFYVYEPLTGGGCGKVRYKFKSYNAVHFKPQYTTEYEWSRIANVLCVANKWAKEYYNGDDGYLIRIENPEVFDKPKELSEFYKPCIDEYKYCQCCKFGNTILSASEEEYAMYHGGCYENFDTICLNRLKRPPQSWCYVEDLGEKNEKY